MTFAIGRVIRLDVGVERERREAVRADLDVMAARRQVHMLEVAVEVVHRSHVVAVDEDLRVARFHFETKSAGDGRRRAVAVRVGNAPSVRAPQRIEIRIVVAPAVRRSVEAAVVARPDDDAAAVSAASGCGCGRARDGVADARVAAAAAALAGERGGRRKRERHRDSGRKEESLHWCFSRLEKRRNACHGVQNVFFHESAARSAISCPEETTRTACYAGASMADTPMRIGSVELPSPFAVAPMAGMTDSAFRRLVKRHGGCGLVVTEMVSSEGLVRGIDRTLEYAEYTEEERPVSIQIFGRDPEKMAAAAQIVEGMGADIVDINMGCPVPKIAKHNAGCSLMREPEHAATVVAAMTRAVNIPVTVKMRAGWNDATRNAPTLARMVEDAGAAAIAVHGRTAEQSYSGFADWTIVADIAERLRIPVFGSGDCTDPESVVARWRAGVEGVLVGRGVLRNPWILAQAADVAGGRAPREVTLADRGRFLHE